MASSALYRYFPSRDALLTTLIIEAFDSLGAAAEAADLDAGDAPADQRWLAVCRAVRGWALDNPHEYALVYGSPVPGYRAPDDTVAPATRVTAVLIGILRDLTAGHAPPGRGSRGPDASVALAEGLAAELRLVAPDLDPSVVAAGMGAWIRLFGHVSLEAFGHFDSVVTERDAFFDHQMTLAFREVAERIRPPRP